MTKVLVVDDSLIQREYISSLLKQSADEVITIHDGEKTIDLVNQYPLDLVVVDIIMPRISDYELCRELKGDLKSKKVPRVMYFSKDQEFAPMWGMRQAVQMPILSNYLIRLN